MLGLRSAVSCDIRRHAPIHFEPLLLYAKIIVLLHDVITWVLVYCVMLGVTDAEVKAQDTSMSSDASSLPPSLEAYDERVRQAVEVESGISMMIPQAYQAPLLVLVSQSVCF